MAVPNPYFIRILLFKSDGVTRPNQNEIARVRAYDVNSGVVTWEGESGFDPSTGGWFPIFMQNIAAFYPPREKPNLRFEVWSTAEQIVHTTQTFSLIPSASTVKIVIGVSDELVGGASSTWMVSGTVRHQDSTPLASGVVRAFDITNGSTKELGSTTLAADGTYAIGYTTADFTSNGGPHAQPNLTVRAFDGSGKQLGQAGPVAASTNQILDVTVPNETGPGPGNGTKRRVFGSVRNLIGLTVSGIRVEAYHLAWTAQGLQEFWLGPVEPPTLSDGAGRYEILYDPPSMSGPENPCGSPAGQINLIVYAKELDGASLKTLFASEVIFDAPAEQEVDLTVNKMSVSTDSEYRRIHEALTPCLGQGATEPAKWATLNRLNERPEFLRFAAQTSGLDEALVRAYVRAWLIAGEINAKMPAGSLSRPMAPELVYALLRVLEAKSLADLLNVVPDDFFDAVVRAVHRGIVATTLEEELFPEAEFGNKSLIDDWRAVLAKLLNQAGTSWQAPLLNLVFPNSTVFPDVLSSTGTPFGSASTAHNVPMPAGIVEGDLLVVLFANRASSGAPGTVTLPSGWTELRTVVSTGSPALRFTAYARKAAGTEGGTNVNFQTSAANQGAAHVYRVSKASWNGNAVFGEGLFASTAATGASTSPNAPSLNVPQPWAAGKTLWLAAVAHNREFALSGSPANYTPTPALRTNSSTSTGNCTLLSARRPRDVASEDPPPFTIQTSSDWAAVTLAVREGLVDQISKREAVVNEHFNRQGAFADVVAALRASNTISAGEAENLTFVFELYDVVGRYFPIVAAVYAAKASQGWHSVRDLAKVPLEGGSGGNDWYHYSLNSQAFTNAGFPQSFPTDVPGNTPDEKAKVYGARLLELFRETGPQERFTSGLGAAAGSDPVLQQISTFLAATPAFDLERTNVDRFVEQNPGALTPQAADKLKQLQRVYRLTSDFAAATALINATPPLDSAVKIARIDEGQFIAEFEEHVGGLTAARNIHRTASHYASEVLFALARFHQNLNEVGGMTAVPGPVDFTVLDPTEGLLPAGAVTQAGSPDSRKFPNWITLFGDLNQCACKHCQTVLSPGAYLVDLLEFVDGAPRRTLFERRPDLEDVELTCPNTDVALPYIDLVNEVLESRVLEKIQQPLRFMLTLTPSVPAVLDLAAAGSVTEFAKVRAAFEAETPTKQKFVLGERAIVKKGAADSPAGVREWVVEDDAWRYSIRQAGGTFTVFPSPQTSANNDSLEVFPEHFHERAYAELAESVFPMNLPLDLGREEIEVFLRAKGVPLHEVLEAFDVRPPAAKLEDPRIARAYLKLSESEANAIFAEGRPAREFWGFSADTAVIPRPDKPTLRVSGNWVSLMALVPVFLHRSGLGYSELLDLLDTEFVHRFAAAPAQGQPHGLHVAAPSAALAECTVNDFQIAHLTDAALRRIGFFLRLWKKLGWSMREVDRYLVELNANEILVSNGAAPASVADTLVRLYEFKRLADELKLAPRVAIAFFRAIDTRRTERHSKSLFDEVFLEGSPAQPEVLALETVARGGTLTLAALDPDTDVRAHVRAALGVKADDLDLLWAKYVDATSGLTLTRDKLTGMFRLATLAAVLKVSVSELFDLEALIGLRVLPAGNVAAPALGAELEATHAALREIRTARLAKMPAAEMIHHLTFDHDADDPFVPSSEDVATAAQRLAAVAAEIAAQNPEHANPDAVALTTELGKVIPAERVATALRIVEAPNAADVEQQTFVTRYFGAFVGEGAAAFLTALAALPENPPAGIEPEERIPARYRFVSERLHVHLLDAARTAAAIAAAAELAGTDEASASALLTRSLGSRLAHPAGTPDTALEDWKKILEGGWDSGLAEIVEATAGEHEATFVAPKGGEYRFVASVRATSGVTASLLSLGVDGEELTAAAPEVSDGRTVVVFGPVTLRAGSASSIRFDYQGTADPQATVTLLFRVGNDDEAVLPQSAVVPFDRGVYEKLVKTVRLTESLALTKAEFRYVVENPSLFDLDALPASEADADEAWTKLAGLIELLALNRAVRLKKGTLFEFFRDVVPALPADAAELRRALEVQTGWKADDIAVVAGLFPAPEAWDSPALWCVLRDAFRVIRKLDIRAAQIHALLVQAPPSIGTAATLRNVFRAQFTKQSWKDVFKPLRDPLRKRQRDALVGYLTTRPIPIGPGGTDVDFIDANDLFAFLLIDVEMEPDTLISRLKLALNVVQLFVHRVFLGLEDTASLGALERKKDQWQWMEKFRVWEANRKVFLYPENWIEPELRDDKTEFFKELEDELLQGPITHETASQALSGYLDKMSEVSNLEIVGTFAEGTPSQGTNYTLHVVGRTRSRSRSLFYRRFHGRQASDGYFTPWQRINLEIEADVIAPAIVNGRLHLFWPKVITKERPREHDVRARSEGGEGPVEGNNPNAFSASERVQYQAEIRVMWSEFNPKKNKWGKPKLTKSRALDDQPLSPFQRDIGDDQPRTEPYHLRIHLQSQHVAIEVFKTNVPVNGQTIVLTTREIKILFFNFKVLIPVVDPTAHLDPKLLGTFRLWETGDDGFDVSGTSAVLGQNYPIGTVLKSNAAHEVDFTVDNKVSRDTLQFSGNTAFLARTPGTFRVFETNFNYVQGADKQPFFYETSLKSLFALNKPNATGATLSQQNAQVVRLSTFNHPLVQTIEQKLQQGGIEGIMQRLVQALPVADDRYYSNYYYDYYYGSLYLGYHIAGDHRALFTTQRIFESEHAPVRATVQPLYPLPTVEFGHGTSFGIYNWELFFHVPMLIANRLSQDLKFEDALRWYHYVFDPKQELNRYERTRRWVSSLPPGCRYWNFLPFFANRKATDSLLETLGLANTLSAYEREQLTALIDEWRRTPFNPHLIARQRIAAYQKFVVMKYLDNLIAWADQLFRQDTFETINEATQLYVLADELLGGRPEEVQPLIGEPRFTYRELRARGIDDFSNAIVEVESLLVSNQPHLKTTELPALGSSMTPIRNIALRSVEFRVPRNERLDRYWDTVQDRLFKIRNSMNIDGVKRRLALFEPPIDPALLVRAAAGGLDLGAVLAQLNAPLPCYRFTVWVQKATELCNELKGFGAALLAALEKKDGEELQLLRQGHEIRMLELVRRVREQQIREAEENVTALELSRVLAEERKEFYRTRVKINEGEQSQIDKTKAATTFEIAQSVAHGVSALFSAVPDSDAGVVGPFPVGLIKAKLGSHLQAVANVAANIAGALASVSRGEATVAGLRAGHERRWDEWKLQERLAQKEIDQINQQIAVASIRLDIAQKELENHGQEIEHAEEVLEFLQDKFTNRDLYQWMTSQLSRTYNQVYKLAYDAARTAERCFEFELGVTGAGFIQFGYIDSLRQGLLAGEKLIHDIKRMDVAFLERNKRELEIQKPVSLAAFDGFALQELRQTGACNFELPEVLFDLDFPGHYFRRIKGVRVTIPCVTGPHTSVSAKLSLLGSTYRRESGGDGSGDDYRYKGFEDSRFVHDPIGITSIATSRAQGDPGMFDFSFRDERYLPFEGAGAMSRWRLELPETYRQFDYGTISDVVMEISYTARDGGGLLKVGAEDAIEQGLNSIRELAAESEAEANGLVRVLSLKREFPDVFHRLLTEGSAAMTLVPEHFPFVIRDQRLDMSIVPDANVENPVSIRVLPKSGSTLPNDAQIAFNSVTLVDLDFELSGIASKALPKGSSELLADWEPEEWTLQQSGLDLDAVDDIVLIANYAVSA